MNSTLASAFENMIRCLSVTAYIIEDVALDMVKYKNYL